MIKSLQISNFQSHAISELEFHPGVNIIVGASDAGKTAIIRALRWVIWNRPSGDSIQSYWSKDTSVRIETEDAVKIIRSKGKVDKYISHVTGEEDLEFKAFGTSVPEEVTQFLNINEINLQQQLDSPFLLSSTAGEVASHWNKVAHLEKIDIGTANVNSAIRELTSSIKYKEEQEKGLQESIEKFEYLEKFEADVEVLEEMEKQLSQLRTKENKLSTLLEKLVEIQVDIDVEKYDIQLEVPVNNLLKLFEAKDDLLQMIVSLGKLLDRIDLVQKDLSIEKEILAIKEPLNILLGLYTEKKTVVDLNTSLVKLLSSINNINLRLNNAKGIQAKLQAEWDLIKVCPLCGSKLK